MELRAQLEALRRAIAELIEMLDARAAEMKQAAIELWTDEEDSDGAGDD